MEDLFCEDGEPKAAAVDLAIKAENFEAFAEAARTLKSQGNEAFGARNWLKAAALYAEAIRLIRANCSRSEVAVSCVLSCGQRVSVKDGLREREGIIACENDDDSFDVMFDDGSEEDGVKACNLRAIRTLSSEETEIRDLEAACFLNSARCAFQLEAFQHSIGLASRAIKLNGSNAAAFFIRGRARLSVPTLDDAKSDLKQAVVMQPSSAEYRRVYEDCKARIKARNEENRKTAAMMLSYMRSEGITGK